MEKLDEDIKNIEIKGKSVDEEAGEGNIETDTDNLATTSDSSNLNKSKDADSSGAGTSKKTKKKARHGKKDNADRNIIRRVYYSSIKFKQNRKRTQSFPTISKFFLPHKRPRKDVFIPPTKFLLGGNISDPLNLNSLQDEDINRAMNAITPESSPLPTPPRHKAKIEVIIPPNICDPLNLMEPLDNDEYEKRFEVQQKRLKKKRASRRRVSESTFSPVKDKSIESGDPNAESAPETSITHSRLRSGSESDNTTQKGKDNKKLRRMDSLDKIVSPVVPQPGAWMRARAPQRPGPPERPASPRAKQKGKVEEQKMPTFHPKNTRYQYGNYDRYYGYRNLNAMMDVRLQVFEMNRHLFQNKDVLDIGCNVGHISMAVARTLGAHSVLGIDIDPVLIERAKKNLRSVVPVPLEPQKLDDDKKSVECERQLSEDCSAQEQKNEKADESKKGNNRRIRKLKKNRKALNKNHEQGQCYFPKSFSMLYGPLVVPPSESIPPAFPFNVSFKQGNYVPREDVAVAAGAECPQFDLILCLSTTKWLHLNWGDAGLKRAFRRMFADLRPGGKLVLESQNWASYKKKKRLTPTIYENFNSIELLPNKFREYLLSPEVGFSKCCILGVPQHASKGFRRPIQLYIKGDFTPSKARWSDAYAPSSHHRPEAEPPKRTVYAPMAPGYRPSDDAPSCGAATPYSPNLDCCADDSPFYNPRSDCYAPSYAPPRPTVYATLPSPLPGSASPAQSPAASPAPSASPAPEPISARVYPGFSPHPQED